MMSNPLGDTKGEIPSTEANSGDVQDALNQRVKELEIAAEKPEENVKLHVTPEGFIEQRTEPAPSEDQDDIDFIPSETYTEAKPGYIFKKGDRGLGYYYDKHGKLLKTMQALHPSTPQAPQAEVEAPTEADPEGERITVNFNTEKWGIGARMVSGPICVTKVKEGGAGESLGVKVGDIIVEIEGVRVAENRSVAVNLIRKGGDAAVTFVRPSDGALMAASTAISLGNASAGKTVAAADSEVPESVREITAMLGTANAANTVTVANQQNTEKIIEDGSFHPNSALVFYNCENCTYTLNAYTTKIYFQGLKNTTVILNGKVITATLEAFRCEKLKLEINTKVGTLQADMCDGLDVKVEKRDDFGMLVWAGCEDLITSFGDDETIIKTGFSSASEKYADLNKERSQFKIQSVHGKIIEEPIVRLDNGYTTTPREKAQFELNQEAKVQAMAKQLGITIKPGKKGIKVKPNEVCPCGSGRKFKKCCNSPDGYWRPDMKPEMYK
eukprot:m.131687 g.131687  ORF g.131687 m.131687 type:complete len:498 (-) comp14633_c0_seq6:561-2054(-)